MASDPRRTAYATWGSLLGGLVLAAIVVGLMKERAPLGGGAQGVLAVAAVVLGAAALYLPRVSFRARVPPGKTRDAAALSRYAAVAAFCAGAGLFGLVAWVFTGNLLALFGAAGSFFGLFGNFPDDERWRSLLPPDAEPVAAGPDPEAARPGDGGAPGDARPEPREIARESTAWTWRLVGALTPPLRLRVKVGLVAAGVLAFGSLFVCTARVEWRGRAIAAGDARALRASPQGDVLAWLQGCEPSGGPESRCDLRVFADGVATKVAGGVLLREGPRFGPDGRLGAIANADPATGRGELTIWSRGSGAGRVAEGVDSFDLGPEGRLVYLAGGKAALVSGGRTHAIRSAPLRSIAAEGGAGPWVAIALGEKGELLGIDAAGRATSLARAVESYRLSPSGRHAAVLSTEGDGRRLLAVSLDGRPRARTLGRGVQSYRVAESADRVAFVEHGADGPGLWVADLGAGERRRVGPDPVEYRWASDAPVLAWVGRAEGRIGVILGPNLAQELGFEVQEFDLAYDGRTVAFTLRSGDLFVADVGGKMGPVRVGGGVRSFGFVPHRRPLVAAHCDGPDCSVGISYPPWALPPGHPLGPLDRPRWELVSRMGGAFYEVAPRAPEGRIRVLGQSKVMLLSEGEAIALDGGIDIHVDNDSILFLPPDGSRIAYVGRAKGREGVYVADLGDWGRPEEGPVYRR